VLTQLTKEKDSGRIFTRLEWGEYFTWAAAPQFKVFMDGRIEIYPDKVWNEYKAVSTGQDWAKILAAYDVDVLVLDTSYSNQRELLAKVDNSPAWRRVFQGRKAVLYLRR
jgi:hypothetical protein